MSQIIAGSTQDLMSNQSVLFAHIWKNYLVTMGQITTDEVENQTTMGRCSISGFVQASVTLRAFGRPTFRPVRWLQCQMLCKVEEGRSRTVQSLEPSRHPMLVKEVVTMLDVGLGQNSLVYRVQQSIPKYQIVSGLVMAVKRVIWQRKRS